MLFAKYHALGNDYLVLDPRLNPAVTELPTAAQISRICHRHFGLGSDGILWGPVPTAKARFGLRILNPDGTEAEKSGNGLRIFARHLHDQGLLPAGSSATVWTLGGVITCSVGTDPAKTVTVDMGIVTFPDGPAGRRLEVKGRLYTVHAADIGNPHCVVPLPVISAAVAKETGSVLETHPHFLPAKTNVQFLRVIDRSTIALEIWERGAGYTLASGSSASASVAVARRLGLCDRNVTVRMPGGVLAVTVGDDYAMTIASPVTPVSLSMRFTPQAYNFELSLAGKL